MDLQTIWPVSFVTFVNNLNYDGAGVSISCVLSTSKGMYAVWICYDRMLPEVESYTNVDV